MHFISDKTLSIGGYYCDPMEQSHLHSTHSMKLSPTNRGIAAILSNNVLMGLAMGMFFPLIPLRLDEAGVPAALVGLNAAASSVGTLMVAPILGFILSHRGYANTVIYGVLIYIASILAMSFLLEYWVWTGLRFLAGIGIALHWVVMESWLNQAAAEDKRGRILSIYVGCIIGGNAAGAVLLDFFGTQGATPFYAIAVLSLLSLLFIPMVRPIEPDAQQMRQSGLWQTARQAPRLMSAGFMMGIAQGCGLTLLAYYGVQAGLTQKQAVWMHAIYLTGGVVLSFPIGWAVDSFERHKMLGLIALASVVTSFAMHWSLDNQWILYPVLFLGGGFTYGVYTTGLALLGERFRHTGMAAANASFVVTWELGTMSGGPIAGMTIALFGAAGFPAVMMLAMGFVLMIAVWRSR